MSNKWLKNMERQEQVQRLIDHGFGELVEALLYGQNKVFTKKNRLNKSGACRELKWKPKQLEDAMAECRRILGPDAI